jgi:hypothetical protein
MVTWPRETRPRRHPRASKAVLFLIFKALHRGRSCFSEILVSPGIGPFDSKPARKVSKLPSPIQDLSSFFLRERPDHADERFFLGTAHHIPNSIAFAYGFTAVDFTPMLA